MENFEKEYFFDGSNGEKHKVIFKFDGQKLRAKCSCTAGKNKTLCKHVTACFDYPEISAALKTSEIDKIYNDCLEKDKQAERLKAESKSLKKKFSRLLLE